MAKPNLAARFSLPFLRLGPVIAYSGLWIACGYLLFIGFIPAASFATERLNLVYWGPMLLLASAVCGAIARAMIPRFSVVGATGLIMLMFFASGHILDFTGPYPWRSWQANSNILDHLEKLHLDSSARIYASPNEHLVFSFYSGLPVQSLLPVRKSFLDSYRGDIVYIDTGFFINTRALDPVRVRLEASKDGVALSREAAESWARTLGSRDYVGEMWSALEPGRQPGFETLPPFASNLLAEHHKEASFALAASGMDLVLRGYDVRTWHDWREAFFYRFASPSLRRGTRANYAERLRGSDVLLLAFSDAALYHSKWHPSGASCETLFQLMP
jgi:hypothetical protein